MIKVLIVEDERHTARYVGQLVDQHPDFTVVGMVANGADALIQLDSNAADLVITDIRMPVMDGIDLLRQLHRKFPQCIPVVLSGYSDFAYTKAAIQNQALDYLLKPVDRGELFALLEKVREIWLGRQREQQAALIRQALEGTLLPQDTAQQVYVLLDETGSGDPEAVFGRGAYLLPAPSGQLIVVEDGDEVVSLAAKFLKTLPKSRPVNLICTEQPVPLWSLRTVSEQLRKILHQKAGMYKPRLLLVNPMEEQSVRTGIPLRDMHPDRAVDAICTRNIEELRAALLDVLILPDLRRMDAQNYLDAIISDSRLAYHMSPGRPAQLKNLLAGTIADAVSPETCASALTAHLLALQNEPEAKRDVTEIVEEIAQQMRANCHLPFNTEALAKQYGFMPRYLNKVFREQKGLRPMEFLLKLRMERAKFMLETVPDALIKDVANSVGYTDPLYFSKMFKRETGLWPKEVQQNMKN